MERYVLSVRGLVGYTLRPSCLGVYRGIPFQVLEAPRMGGTTIVTTVVSRTVSGGVPRGDGGRRRGTPSRATRTPTVSPVPPLYLLWSHSSF